MLRLLIGLVCLAIFAMGCHHTAAATPSPPAFIRLAGSTSLPLDGLLAAYTARHPHVNFEVRGGGSDLGQALVERGAVDIGVVSWLPDTLTDTVEAVILEPDAIAIIVHPANNTPGLSVARLRDVFSGRLLNWRAVDGPVQSIQVVSREDGSGTRQAFEALVMDDMAVTLSAVVLPHGQAVIDYVAEHRGAIGYVSQRQITGERVRVLPLEGLLPTVEDVNYLLIRDFLLLVPRDARSEVRAFVDFARSSPELSSSRFATP